MENCNGYGQTCAPDATTLLKWKAPRGQNIFHPIHAFDAHLAGSNTWLQVSLHSEGLGKPALYYYAALTSAPTRWAGYKLVKVSQAKRAVPAAGIWLRNARNPHFRFPTIRRHCTLKIGPHKISTKFGKNGELG